MKLQHLRGKQRSRAVGSPVERIRLTEEHNGRQERHSGITQSLYHLALQEVMYYVFSIILMINMHIYTYWYIHSHIVDLYNVFFKESNLHVIAQHGRH